MNENVLSTLYSTDTRLLNTDAAFTSTRPRSAAQTREQRQFQSYPVHSFKKKNMVHFSYYYRAIVLNQSNPVFRSIS